MKHKRREFIKLTGITGLGIAGSGLVNGFAGTFNNLNEPKTISAVATKKFKTGAPTMIGQYGEWASNLTANKLPSLSFRNKEFSNLPAWKKAAKKRMADRLAIPDIGKRPPAQVNKKYVYDGLHIEELSWQRPYGEATQAILLKPENSTGKLPAILAFHDHGGNKYFGTRKITRTSDERHP
jgi:hypothetical protein